MAFTESNQLIQRQEATRSTLDRFIGHDLEIGKYDCGLLVISHLKNMGWKIPTGGTWNDTNGIKRFLRRHGGNNGADCLDAWGLARIAPAQAIIGDVVQMQTDSELGAFGVCLGNGRVLAYHEDAPGVAVIQPTQPLAAWRL